VRRLLSLVLVAVVETAGCRVLSSGLPGDDAGRTGIGADAMAAPPETPGSLDGRMEALSSVEQPGRSGSGCSDDTREGFRDEVSWQMIAGCAGGFALPGVTGNLAPACARQAGDSSSNPTGAGCNAADLCAIGWHVCLDGSDVARHSPTGDCEGCVAPGEPRFFLVASGASAMGVCTVNRSAANDLHGCGGLGEPESPDCAPLTRRMGFADCLTTEKVWSCGTAAESTEEAAVVTKGGPTLGGVLCCSD
jgi:hypothetical protein